MGKLRQSALILGEGPTEFFYFKSLCDVFKRLTIKPDYPKHTNIKELDAKIAEGVEMGYSHIFCIIDMDTKDKEPERSQYQKLKAKYAKPIDKPTRKGWISWGVRKKGCIFASRKKYTLCSQKRQQTKSFSLLCSRLL